MYRSHHHDAQQGELCTAPSAKPGTKLSLLSRSVGPTGTKLSQHAHTSSPTGTKLSQHTPPAAQPVQNSPNTHRPTSLPRISSPSTPKNGVFRLFCACWASFVAHKQPTGHAGRVFSRSMVRTDSPGGSFHWDRLLEPMSVAHGCDNGETTAGGASLRCLLRRVGAWPGSTRTIQTRPIGGCHVADRAWQQHPSAVARPGPASRRRTKPTSKPRDGPRSDRAWQQHPSAVARPGPDSRRGLAAAAVDAGGAWPGFETGPGCGGRGRRRGLAGLQDRSLRAVRLACGDHAGRPPPTDATHGRIKQPGPTNTHHQTRATRHAPGTPSRPTTTDTTESGPEPLGSGPPSILSDYRRCAPGGTTRQVLTGARQQSAVSSARPPCRPCRSSRR